MNMRMLLCTALLLPLTALWFFTAAVADDEVAAADAPARRLIETLGCRGCHQIKGYGGSLAADLTAVGSRLTASEIMSILSDHTVTRTGHFMPTYSTLTPEELELIGSYLYNLR
jgi:ubiquinol-cytochrome c reductase cytochrome b subunit